MLRGDPPVLDRILFGVSGQPPTDSGRLQNRKLPKAVAVVLTLFRAQSPLALFRVHMSDTQDCLVRTVLNAKNDTVTKSPLNGLAVCGLTTNESNRFLHLFLGPTNGKTSRAYLEVDVARLQPGNVTIKLDGVEVSDAEALKSITRKIAAQQPWELADYHFDIQPKSPRLSENGDSHEAQAATEDPSRKAGSHSLLKVDLSRFSPELTPLELNYAALRSVCDLINKVYIALGEFVEPYQYGISWVLRDKRLGTVMKNRRILDGLGTTGGPVPDRRPLSDAGITAGMETRSHSPRMK